jgi:predicted membrane protein
MGSLNSLLSRLAFILRVILMIPWTIFWLIFAIIVAPFQIAYHMSNAGNQLHQNFDQNHADQNFKRGIYLIEIHKLRFGSYPNTLNDPNFTAFMGEWDKFIYQSVTYSKHENGYELNLNSQENAQLEYPELFWSGLGIIRTNVKGLRQPGE